MTAPAGPTPWHTIGPFFPGGFFCEGDNDLARVGPRGRRPRGTVVHLVGMVLQDGGAPAINAVLEAWQADADGRFRHPADPHWRDADPDFVGWGRAWTDGEGRFAFRTILPGSYADDLGRRAPHVNVSITASGIMVRLNTTLFFPGDSGNEGDPVLMAVEPARRERLILRAELPSIDGAPVFSCNLTLRGENETPFFAE